MNATITKSTLGEVNHGHCESRNNARYKGNTVVYRVEFGEDTHYATTKWLAEDFAQWLNEGNWNGRGDAEMAFAQYENPLALRYLSSETAKLASCW